MKKQNTFRPDVPYDDLPLLPPPPDRIEDISLYKQEAVSRAALAELKGVAQILPAQEIFVNAISMIEAKDSSEIENIITTHDDLYEAISVKAHQRADPNTKEVLRYREALRFGEHAVHSKGFITINDIVRIQKIIVDNDAGIRRLPGTALINDRTNETVFTPPQDIERIDKLLKNYTEYLNDDETTLIKAAILHYQIESIHPFYDGNGRTGRIINVLYLILKKHLDVPILYLSSYIIQNKGEYYRLLLDVTKTESWSNWIQYFLKGIEITATETIRKIKSIRQLIDQTIDIVKQNASKIYSKELVETLFLNPYCKNEFIEKEINVERKAASRYLHKLVDIGILKMRKIGRENIFINTKLMQLLQTRLNITHIRPPTVKGKVISGSRNSGT